MYDEAKEEVHTFLKFVYLLLKQPTNLEHSEIYTVLNLQPEK